MPSVSEQPPAIRDATSDDRPAIEQLLLAEWRTTWMISAGVEHELTSLPALVAYREGRLVGLATLALGAAGLEIVTLNALEPHRGLGSALLAAAAARARTAGAARLWLITTNDNLDAIRFYQRRGLTLVALHPEAVTHARERKPQIPLVGNYGIPLRDELELELRLD